ncbi:hypothetical protein EVAR_36089_1 [Eumeta japonica]|uniref:Histone-lysine N-methyltransferase SETMAR n=1 Tax=Eumeta variegata TaxID=151549 RepID=A0A4C1YIV7_EUMVA|nr:hypothetical protein EVAR_36089_1 [Eumeta japonica]
MIKQSPQTGTLKIACILPAKPEILARPPYSSDLAPSDFYLFPKIKETFAESGLRSLKKQWLYTKTVKTTPKFEGYYNRKKQINIAKAQRCERNQKFGQRMPLKQPSSAFFSNLRTRRVERALTP